MTLPNRPVLFRQNSTGLLAPYDEINLNATEKILIFCFLENCRLGVRLTSERNLIDKKVTGSLDNFYKFIENRCLANERTYSWNCVVQLVKDDIIDVNKDVFSVKKCQ